MPGASAHLISFTGSSAAVNELDCPRSSPRIIFPSVLPRLGNRRYFLSENGSATFIGGFVFISFELPPTVKYRDRHDSRLRFFFEASLASRRARASLRMAFVAFNSSCRFWARAAIRTFCSATSCFPCRRASRRALARLSALSRLNWRPAINLDNASCRLILLVSLAACASLERTSFFHCRELGVAGSVVILCGAKDVLYDALAHLETALTLVQRITRIHLI